MEKIAELVKSGNATIVDVRTPGEFMGGHVSGSINIPLQEIPSRMDELKKLNDIVLCCASGMRSSQARQYLISAGIDCHDAGPWTNVNYLVNN